MRKLYSRGIYFPKKKQRIFSITELKEDEAGTEALNQISRSVHQWVRAIGKFQTEHLWVVSRRNERLQQKDHKISKISTIENYIWVVSEGMLWCLIHNIKSWRIFSLSFFHTFCMIFLRRVTDYDASRFGWCLCEERASKMSGFLFSLKNSRYLCSLGEF